MTLSPGTLVAHYRVLDRIGVGGMGEVYRAEDTKLGRAVALKFLTSSLNQDERAHQRLVREARSASALDHPNVCTVHELGETEDGQIFICMSYYPGETLKDRIAEKKLDIEELVEVAVQVASGLASAHQHGIVHRDIKPSNVLITDDGLVKILDFGLARGTPSSADVTDEGRMAGTVPYMAPEALLDGEIGCAADIWSFGVLLYEAWTQRLPFRSTNQGAVVLRILREEPDTAPEMVGGLVAERLRGIIEQCLQKEPRRRYLDMEEVIDALVALRQDVEADITAEARIRRQSTVPSIAVLPFQDLSPDRSQEYFCDGLAEELILALAQLPGLRVVSRGSSFQFKGKPEDRRRIGKLLNAQTLLEGSVRKSGDDLRISTELLAATDGFCLWAERYDRKLEDVFAVQEDIARRVAERLKGELLEKRSQELVQPGTHDPEVYTLYLEGRFFMDKRTARGLQRAIESFGRALERQPEFARASAALAHVLLLQTIYGFAAPRAVMKAMRSYADAALEHEPDLPEAHAVLGIGHAVAGWDRKQAQASLEHAAELDPNSAFALQSLALYHHVPQLEFTEAAAQLAAALESDPLSLVLRTSQGLVAYLARDYDRALQILGDALYIEENFALARHFRAHVWEELGRWDLAISEQERALELVKRSNDMLASLGRILARSGERERAYGCLQELEARAEEEWVSPYHTAHLRLGLGEEKEAMSDLEKSAEERDPALLWIGSRPFFDPLRSTSRFQRLLDRLDLRQRTD